MKRVLSLNSVLIKSKFLIISSGYYLSVLIFSLFPSFVYSQCNPAPPLFMQNPSFEGPQQPHVTPGPWETCKIGQTPDTQPGSWGVTLPASNGNSYLGLVAEYGGNWQEGASQQLSGPLQAGVEYSFTVDLSNTHANGGGIDPGCAEVQIWAGYNRCDKLELLWSSGDLTNYDQWKTYTVTFIPTQNYTWFSFIINPLGCSTLPYVLVDNIGPIQPKTVKVELEILQGILCNNVPNAVLQAHVKGDYSPFTYNWSAPLANRLNDSTYQNLFAGTYAVTVTDHNNCQASDTITISQPPALVFKDEMVLDANCLGLAGSAYLEYTGGTGSAVFPYYDYTWDNGSKNPGTQTPIAAGWHQLTIADINGCTVHDSVLINVGSGIYVDTIIRKNNCLAPSNNIEIVLVPTAGKAPFTYNWSTVPIQTDSIADNLNTGVYSVTIADAIGCKDTLVFDVTTPPKGLFITPTITNVSCNGGTNGNIALSVIGINTVSTFNWSPNVSTTANATNLVAGTYKVTVTDITGCQDTATMVVTEPTPLLDSTSVMDVRCYGKATGYISVDISGGVPPYTYLWSTSPPQVDSIVKNLIAGSYTVTVSDSLGCQHIITKNISEPAQPLFSSLDSSSLKCFGDTTAYLHLIMGGGTPGYFYEWSTDTSFLENTAQINNLGAGTYYVRGIDQKGCSIYDTITILQPAEFKHPNFTAPNVCQNQSTLFTNLTDTVGVSNTIKWIWSFGDNAIDSVFNVSHQYATADSFHVKLIANTNGCIDSITKTVKTFAMPDALFSVADVCQNKSATINNSSSILKGTMQYNWTFGDASPNSNSNTATITHNYTSPGAYTIALTLTSDSGCVDTASKVVNIFKNYLANFTATKVCEQDSTVFVNTTDTTGNVALVWTWTYGDASGSNVYQQNHLYTTGGNYTVNLKIVSAQGCIDSIAQNIRVNYQPHANFTLSNVCQKDTLFINNLSTLGGGSMAYNWNFGDGFSSTTNPAKHKYLSFGNYTVSVTLTSDSGCVDTLSKTVHIGKNNNVVFSSTPVCEGSATNFINTTDSTGSGGVNWLWNFGDNATNTSYSSTHTYAVGGSYSVLLTATTIDGCIDSLRKNTTVNYQPHANFTLSNVCQKDTLFINNLSTLGGGSMAYNWNFGDGFSSTTNPPKHKYLNFGNYTVSVTLTSDSGCVDTLSKTVHIGKNNNVVFSSTPVCEGTATNFINTTDSTGSGGVNWLWNFGDNTTGNTFNASHTYTPGGTYTVLLTATTIDGCTDSLTKTTQVNYQPHPDFTFTDACMGSSNTFTNNSSVNGGSYSNQWNFGDGASTSTMSPSHVYASFGAFSVLLTTTADSGCIDSIRKTVNVFEVPVANYRADSVCLGETTNFQNKTNSGTFVVQSWSWDLGDGTTENAISPNHVYANAGLYATSLIVTTTNGCSDTIAKSVKVNGLPDVSSVVVEERCFNTLDGSITLTPTAGQAPFTYYWNSAIGSNTLNNIGAGHYTVIYQDANECVGTQTFDLNAKNEIFIEATALDVKCFNEKNGYINIFAYGGVSSFSYLWNTGATTPTLTNVAAGIYDITVTDAAGCSLDTSITINEPLPLAVTILPQDTLYIGNSTTLTLNYVTNFNNPSFSWSPTVGLSCNDCETPIASPFNTTSYEVTMTDSTGCKVKNRITIYVKANHPLYVPNAFSPNGDGYNDYFNAFTDNYRDFNMRIFNRWGEKIYETTIPGDNDNANRFGWDGIYKANLQQPGVYVYEVEVVYLDGFTQTKNGSFTLIR